VERYSREALCWRFPVVVCEMGFASYKTGMYHATTWTAIAFIFKDKPSLELSLDTVISLARYFSVARRGVWRLIGWLRGVSADECGCVISRQGYSD